MSKIRISAYISDNTKRLVEQYAKAHGVTKGSLIDEALLHHLQALRELPAEVIIPPRIIVTEKTAKQILARIRKPRRPTKAMRDLFRDCGE
jgi:hypothetical protein